MGTKFVFIWRRSLEAGFDLVGIFARGQTRAIGNPENVRIDRDCRLPECFVQDDIRGFASDAGQADERVAGLRHFAVKFIQKHLAERNDILRFVAPQANRFDVAFNPFKSKRQHFFWRIGDLEQAFGRLVDPHISGLCGQSDRDNQRIRVDEIKLGLRVRAILGQMREQLCGLGLAEGARGALALVLVSSLGLGHHRTV